jgi:bla regulator protein blaR1
MAVLIALVLKSLAIAGLTLLAVRLTRHRSAAERSLIAHLGLLALVALPVATLLLPALRIPLPEMTRAEPAAADSVTPTRMARTAPATEAAVVSASPAPEVSSETPLAPILQAFAPYAYALPVGALLLLTFAALMRLVRLRAQAEVLVDPVWLSALAHAQRRMGHKSGTALLVSDTLPSPISWGLARPTILLSADALAASDEAEAIIAHELAHVTALDWAKLMLARIATAIHWFNPLAWRLAREAHQLREEAADDAVLAADIAAPDYAQLLVRVARHESKGLLLGAHGVAPGKGSLKRRVGRVLDGTLPRGPARGSWMAGFGAGMLVMAAPLAALTVSAAHDANDLTDPVAGTTRRAAVATMAGTPRTVSTTTITAITSSSSDRASVRAPEAPEAPQPPQTPQTPVPPQRVGAHQDAARQARDAELDSIVAAKAMGITPQYLAELRRAAPQLGPIDMDDATAMRAVGVTPDYLRAMAATGLHGLEVDDIVSARAVGVEPSYVRAMVAAGIRGSIDDYVSMRAVGVTAEDVRAYRAAGIAADPDAIVGRKVRHPDPRPNPRPRPVPDEDEDGGSGD